MATQSDREIELVLATYSLLPLAMSTCGDPRLKNKALLLDITIVNPCAGANLGNGARHVGKHLADAVERKKNKYRSSSPLPTPSFLSLCRHVVTLAQTCMPLSRSSPPDGYSTGRRHTPMSPNIWRKG